jgi:hypothetical protein
MGFRFFLGHLQTFSGKTFWIIASAELISSCGRRDMIWCNKLRDLWD